MSDPRNFFVHSLLRAHNWQHRPQLDAVCDWWRGSGVGFQPAHHDDRKLEAYATRGRGVCALIGMGGAGKTAVAERFLRMLPGGLPADPEVAKDTSLPTAHSTFVFSFYDAPNVEVFFESLQMWLEDTPRLETVLSVGQMMFLLQQTRGLIVLDGLERVQEDGQRGKFGRLASPKLRDFLDPLAAGNVPELSVLVTSRFPLADLRDKRPQFFRTIAVDQIELPAGVELLRQRGVQGTDPQLAPIVHQCGRHALTVDFAGGYIAEYGQGDPATPLDLGTAEQLQAAAEEELDEDRQEVLRQGYRFARIAEHYRDAMLAKDEAAMALLERICLFRLGVDALALATIFSGEQAVEVSGRALARLNAKQLQSKLDWLVRMRIVEATSRPDQAQRSSGSDEESPERRSARSGLRPTGQNLEPGDRPVGTGPTQTRILYSIHPAVRDGFLSGIGRDAALAGHEAVRKGLEVSLGEAPGKNPSDPATLDLLEEIVHHTLQSGHVREAWDIYWNRIGNFDNLGWRLGAYERGKRICSAFADGQSPGLAFSKESDGKWTARRKELPLGLLTENRRAIVINEWGLYLDALGDLSSAACCFEEASEIASQQDNLADASLGNQNLCDMWLLSGRLVDSSRLGARERANQALQLARSEPRNSARSQGSLAHAFALHGEIPAALEHFRTSLTLFAEADKDRSFSHGYEGFGAVRQYKARDDDKPLDALDIVWHIHLLFRLGRELEAKQKMKQKMDSLVKRFGENNDEVVKCKLTLSALDNERGELPSAESLCASARDWALARDAKEVLCWSYLVEAQHAVTNLVAKVAKTFGDSPDSPDEPDEPDEPKLLASFATAHTAIESGLKIARDCGFGLYHIDLLLTRARLHLLRSDAGAALDDIEVAVDTGIPANEETGQVELLAANHQQCGYAWAIPLGLQLRAEALLFQAAQKLGRTEWHSVRDDADGLAIRPTIDQAKQLLHEALDCWHDLRDPEPTEDNNFKLDGKEYNYRAAETHQVMLDLESGILTRYPFLPVKVASTESESKPPTTEENMSKRFNVALSFPGEHRAYVEEMANALVDTLTKEKVFYDRFYEAELSRPNLDTYLQEIYHDHSELVVVVLCKEYDEKEWCGLEFRAIRDLIKKRSDDEIMFVRVADGDVKGVFGIDGYVDAKGRPASDIAGVICERLRIVQAVNP